METTPENHYTTSMPTMLTRMYMEALNSMQKISEESCLSVLESILQTINDSHTIYANELETYASQYFSNQQMSQEYFTKQMIANANNCESVPHFLAVVRDKYKRHSFNDIFGSSHSQTDRYESISKLTKIKDGSTIDLLIFSVL